MMNDKKRHKIRAVLHIMMCAIMLFAVAFPSHAQDAEAEAEQQLPQDDGDTLKTVDAETVADDDSVEEPENNFDEQDRQDTLETEMAIESDGTEEDEQAAEERDVADSDTPEVPELDQTPAPLYVLDLIDMQRRALADNPSLAAASERVQQVRQMVKQARSMYLPQIDMSYTYSFTWLPKNYTDSLNAYLDQTENMLRDWRKDQILASTISRQPALRDRRNMRNWYRSTQQMIDDARKNLESPVENTTMDMTIGLLLFDGFAREFLNAMARYGYGEAQAAFREGQRILLDAIAQAYYGAQFAREQIEIGKSDIAFYERLHKEALARREIGRGATSHVLSFETLLYASRANQLRSQRDYEMARIILAMLLGLPEGRLDERFDLAELEWETEETMMLPDADAMLSLAFAYRPDLEQNELGLKRAQAAVKREYASFAPQILAVGMVQTSNVNETGFEPDRLTTTVGLNASLNLFSGGRRRASVIEAKHARREAELRIVEAEQKIKSDVYQALTDLRIAQEALQLQLDAAGSVEKNRDLVELEYNAGKAMLVSLSQAQRDYMQARGMLSQARVNLQRTWQALHAATGTNLIVLLGEHEDSAVHEIMSEYDKQPEE